MTHILETASLPDIRDELQQLVLNDLLGPADGEEEEVNELYVRERYLVGMLAPQQTPFGRDEDDDVVISGVETTEEGSPDSAAPRPDSLIPSSFGMTFCLAADLPHQRD